jgi:hypothetical protein
MGDDRSVDRSDSPATDPSRTRRRPGLPYRPHRGLAPRLLVGGLIALVACGLIQAQAGSRLRLPVVARQAELTHCSTPREPLPTPTTRQPPTDEPRLAIAKHTAWTSGGCHHIAVEVTNRGGTAYYPEVTATYYDAAGTLVGRQASRTHLFTLPPGRGTTGRLISQPASGWARYELAVSWPPVDEDLVGVDLEVVDLRGVRADRTVHVTGRLRNRGITDIRDAVVDVGLYRGGELLEAGAARPFGNATAVPGEPASFDLPFFHPDGRLVGYDLVVRAGGMPVYAP